jgi:hypothetical protein
MQQPFPLWTTVALGIKHALHIFDKKLPFRIIDFGF